MEKGAHVPFHPTLADVSDQTKRAFSAVAAERVAAKLEAKARPMEFQAKLEAAAQFALDAEAHEARRKLAKKKRQRDKKKKKKKKKEAGFVDVERQRLVFVVLGGGGEEEEQEA